VPRTWPRASHARSGLAGPQSSRFEVRGDHGTRQSPEALGEAARAAAEVQDAGWALALEVVSQQTEVDLPPPAKPPVVALQRLELVDGDGLHQSAVATTISSSKGLM